MNKKFLALCAYMFLCAVLGLFFYLSPLSILLAKNKSFSLSLVYAGEEKKDFKGWLLVFEPPERKYRLIKPSGKINLSGSVYNRAYELRRKIEGAEPLRESFFYAGLDEDLSMEILSSFSGAWRQDPKKLLAFTRAFVKVFSSSRSNLNLPDKLSVYFELLKAKPLDFSYLEIDVSKQESESEAAPQEEPAKKIKIKFTDASGKKHDIEKTLSFLRSKGFDTMDFKRLRARKKTEIISYENNALAARRLAEELGIKNSAVMVRKEKYNIYEAEIIAGEDFNFIK